MIRILARWLVLAMLVASPCAFATTVTIHTEDARAILDAIRNPLLTHEQALRVVQMHGNQAIIRKLHEFKIQTTTKDFASALYKTAHGEPITELKERCYLFYLVTPKLPQIREVLKRIETHPKEFESVIEQRIAEFTPKGAQIHLDGYVLAAGDGGGYAFGGTDFYMNIGMVDDYLLAREITTHELYHAVQGAYKNQRHWNNDATDPKEKASCDATYRLFSNLYEEGTATYVGNVSLIRQSHAELAEKILTDLDDGLGNLKSVSSLLELSVTSLNAPNPVPYDEVYNVGFFGHAVLYSIAYAMAQSIAEADGPQGLTDLLTQPSYQFILRYTQLPKYGLDRNHPKLGPNTIAAANLLATSCKTIQ